MLYGFQTKLIGHLQTVITGYIFVFFILTLACETQTCLDVVGLTESARIVIVYIELGFQSESIVILYTFR